MLRAWLEGPALSELARLAQLVGLARLKKLFSTTRCTVNFDCQKQRKTRDFLTLSPRSIDQYVTYSANARPTAVAPPDHQGAGTADGRTLFTGLGGAGAWCS